MALIELALALSALQSTASAPFIGPRPDWLPFATGLCHLPRNYIHVGSDDEGDFLEIDPGSDDSEMPGGVQCFADVAERAGVRIAFQAEPNGTQPVAAGPMADILLLRQAARTCAIPARIDRRSDDRHVLLVNRPAIADGLECLTAWMEDNRSRLQLEPMGLGD